MTLPIRLTSAALCVVLCSCGTDEVSPSGEERPPPPPLLPEALPTDRPDRGYTVEHYDLHFRLPPSGRILIGTASVSVAVERSQPELELDFVGFEIGRVMVDDKTVAWRRSMEGSAESPDSFFIAGPFAAGERYVLSVEYSGTPTLRQHSLRQQYITGFQGFEGNALITALKYTQNQPEGARLWFPSLDHPAFKATLRLSFEVPVPLTAISNGVLQDENPPVFPIDGVDYRRFVWVETHAIATYLIAAAVGPLNSRKYTVGTLPIVDYYSDAVDGEAVREKIEPVIRLAVPMLESMFGIPYPFDKYGHFFASEGRPIPGLEHQTITLLDAELILRGAIESRESTVVHELAHAWFGNYVTPKDHRNYWFNEGLATLSSVLYQEKKGGETPLRYYREMSISTRSWRTAWTQYLGFYLDDVVLADLPERERLGAPVYAKAAAVFMMLRMELGDEAFFMGLRNILTQNAFGNVGPIEIQQAFEQASGIDLRWFFDQWVYGKAYVVLNYGCAVQKSPIFRQHQLDCTFEQIQNDYPQFAQFWKDAIGGSVRSAYPLVRVSLPIWFENKDMPEVFREVRIHLEPVRKQTISLCLDETPGPVAVDPLNFLYGTRRQVARVDAVRFRCTAP